MDPGQLYINTPTVIGISVAIAGNVLISLALNVQKLAHKRLDAEKLSSLNNFGKDGAAKPQDDGHSSGPSLNERDEDQEAEAVGVVRPDDESDIFRYPETVPLMSPNGQTNYGSSPSPRKPHKRSFAEFLSRPRFGRRPKVPMVEIPVDVVVEGNASPQQNKFNENGRAEELEQNEGDYLKSKLWWSGFLLMNVGEIGNFISYAWAPASVVAPLGTFALIANCFFAPLLLREQFRKRDILGILLAIIGAVTVVLASSSSDTRLDPDGLMKAISQTPFIVYSCIYVAGSIILSILSEGTLGRRWVTIDVGLCALFAGGFTVLSTKAISTLLTMQWIEMFASPITYPVLLVLAVTGIGQIRYLNRALMRFDSKIVIPTQFVLFNLSAIVGSALLYGDFQKASFHQIVTFLYGCAATFAGVYIIARSPSDNNASDQSEDQVQTEDTQSGNAPEDTQSPRARRATLVLPSPRDTPGLNLRHRQSTVNLIGLTSAQHLLLVHTPPRESLARERDFERGTPVLTPDPYQRHRAQSWRSDGSLDVIPRDSSVSRRPQEDARRSRSGGETPR
ncbi:magnesium transporter NIPA-domain-containing protein [Desarmillaria tabescens]|uniref:Magnesium transporter NIPA-domain-containing protein n=1 Tax=Armillaria tabescens TaxID=1929756 RepID=A0AA39NLW6_ARMTA|nr:magnesium transporter NIPA-domain-containing protein [Desarmillaria tabescens]KAK0468054.1 magnesium transporter NIPA-domain-containing protein [Desarmillaria tabescens]